MKQGTLSWSGDRDAKTEEEQTTVPDRAVFPLFEQSAEASSSSRPLRQSRSKAPLTYKEDLKAILKADAVQEACLHNASEKRSRKSLTKAPAAINVEEQEDDFQVVKQTKAPEAEAKPLSLAVKGFGTVANGQAHPFFVKKAKPPPIPPETPTATEQVKPNSTTAWKSLFSSSTTSETSSASGSLKATLAPWPSADSTHVTQISQAEAGVAQRLKDSNATFSARWSSASVAGTQHVSAPQDEANTCVQDMTAPKHISIPACVDVSGSSPSGVESARHQLWTDAWRPQTAQQCLGNESNAAYLAEWMRKLLVGPSNPLTHGASKRKQAKTATVQRRVDRKKRRRKHDLDEDDDEMADFIVDDDDDEEEQDEQMEAGSASFGNFGRIDSDDEPEAIVVSQESIPSTASTAPTSLLSSDRLTNCIVLSGPSGAGKTAAVYACASELGFEVFELYPGMGRRAGKDMLGAVGDLGRNHMVSSGGSGGGATRKQHPFAAVVSATAVTARQSLILIEEADLLFEEDKGFWSAVIELVAESRRPIIITCNEEDLIPLHDLPIQVILRFVKPSMDKVVPYLHKVASTVAEQDLRALLQQTRTDFPNTLDDQGVDVRQAIAQLHFGCYVDPDTHHEQELDPTLSSLLTLAKAAETLSVADLLDSREQIEAHGDNGVEQQASVRQLGSAWRQLIPQPRASRFEQSHLGPEYKASLLHLVRNSIALQPATRLTTLALDQVRHMRLVDDSIRCVLRTPQPQLAIVLDYAPIVRIMGIVDDDLYQIYETLRARANTADAGGRNTRNSVRSFLGLDDTPSGFSNGYVRWLPLGPHETSAVRQTSLLWK